MTKDTQLVALGNALVDIEFQLSHEELEQTNLRKGGMTLASIDEQQSVLHHLKSVDGILSSGGSAANTVIAFSQFGGTSSYKSLLGDDEYGHFYSKEFHELGVALYADKSSNYPTGTCVVLITPDGERTMQTSLGVNVHFSESDIDENSIKRAEWLYIEGYKFTEDSGVNAIDKALYYAEKHDTKVAVTLSDTFIVQVFREPLLRVLSRADLAFCNEYEAMALGETESLQDAYKAMLGMVPNFTMTLGSNGSIVNLHGKREDIPAVTANVLNTNGAGDMYAGAFLYGITHGHSAIESGSLASYASAKVVEQHGARLKSSHIEVKNKVLDKR